MFYPNVMEKKTAMSNLVAEWDMTVEFFVIGIFFIEYTYFPFHFLR